MPRVLNIYPKDIQVALEFPIQDLEKIVLGLQCSTIDYDGENEEEKEAMMYISTVFFPFINEVVQEVRNGPRPNSQGS